MQLSVKSDAIKVFGVNGRELIFVGLRVNDRWDQMQMRRWINELLFFFSALLAHS